MVVQFKTATDLLDTVLCLRLLLCNKEVRLNVNQYHFSDNNLRKELDVIDAPSTHSLLEIFKYWRCQDLIIHNTNVDSQIQAAVISTVTSRKPVYDLLTIFFALFDGGNGKAFQNEIPREVRRAATSLLPPALVADVDEFLQEKKKGCGSCEDGKSDRGGGAS